MAYRRAVRVVTALRTCKCGDALFEEDTHHLQGRPDGEREQTQVAKHLAG